MYVDINLGKQIKSIPNEYMIIYIYIHFINCLGVFVLLEEQQKWRSYKFKIICNYLSVHIRCLTTSIEACGCNTKRLLLNNLE